MSHILTTKLEENSIWHKYSAILSRIHSYGLLFRRFCPLGVRSASSRI